MCLCVGLLSLFLLLPFSFILPLGSQPEIQEFPLSQSSFSPLGGYHAINILSLFQGARWHWGVHGHGEELLKINHLHVAVAAELSTPGTGRFGLRN